MKRFKNKVSKLTSFHEHLIEKHLSIAFEVVLYPNGSPSKSFSIQKVVDLRNRPFSDSSVLDLARV